MKISAILHPVKLCRWYWRAANRKIHNRFIFNEVYRDELCWIGRIVVRLMVMIQRVML